MSSSPTQRPEPRGRHESAPGPGWPAVDRRRGGDRRQQVSPLNWRAILGRRRRLRRAEDRLREDLRLDWYEPHLLAVALAIVILCLADAHNTLLLLEAGARELNLLMDHLIQEDVRRFVALKVAVTALSVLVLVAYHQVALWDRLRVQHALYAVMGGYAALVAYEVFLWQGPVLLFFLFPP